MLSLGWVRTSDPSAGSDADAGGTDRTCVDDPFDSAPRIAATPTATATTTAAHAAAATSGTRRDGGEGGGYLQVGAQTRHRAFEMVLNRGLAESGEVADLGERPTEPVHEHDDDPLAF